MLETARSVFRFRGVETGATARRLSRAASVADLRAIARRRLPRGVFAYIDGAAEDERTLARNRLAYEQMEFRPRVLRDVARIDTRTTLLGREIPFPLALSPTGFGRIADSAGELAVAASAAERAIPYTLSTLSTRSIEEVAAVSDGSKWFQVYVWKDRGLVEEMVRRAAAAGYEAIMLTVDTAVLGRRERDIRVGFTHPPRLGLDTIIDGLLHPSWTWDFLRAEPIVFENVVRGRGGVEAVSLSDFVNEQFDSSLSWRDVDWLRSIWDGPMLIKGIQTVEDAELAAEAGVDAIVLSNHGGRQLDDAPATLDLVGPVADRVADRLEVLCDGGVRRGSDIAKAVALGARACMCGRPYLYGLGAGGRRGVDLVLDWLREGFERTMALLGVTDVGQLGREHVRPRPDSA